jgi:c-di-AMP phosphodiesterase-like protein
MDNFNHTLLEDDIRLAKKIFGLVKLLKISLALLVLISYFFLSEWLTEIIIISVVVILIFPLDYFDVFIQKLVEYNTQKLEERQTLNANEANKYFDKIFNKIGK